MKSVYVAIGIAAFGFSLPCFADDAQLPAMNAERPVLCLRDSADQVWRIQCDPSTRVCLFAPNEELDGGGNRVKPLERARTCELDAPFDRKKMEADGYTFVPGRVDAPYGWMRDERQRVFQVNFDLKRRMYFGVAYTPEKFLENPLASTRTSIDFGLFVFDVKTGTEAAPTMHRFRLFEGQVHMAPFSSELVMVHYDMSHRFVDPLLRITTFVGEPERHDLALDLGMWNEVGGLEIHPTPYGFSQLWRHATAQVTLDLWQSHDLDSFVRVRTGLGLEGQHDDVNGYRSAIAETSAFEIDTVLDKAGLSQPAVRVRPGAAALLRADVDDPGAHAASVRAPPVRDRAARDQRPAAHVQARRRRREARRPARRSQHLGVRDRRRTSVQFVDATAPQVVVAVAILLAAAPSRADSCTGVTETRRAVRDVLRSRKPVVAHRPLPPSGSSIDIGFGIALRHEITFDDDPDLEWKMSHVIIDGSHDTLSSGFDGVVYSGLYLRHSRDGHIVVPFGVPKKIYLPFDVGALAEVGTLRLARRRSDRDGQRRPRRAAVRLRAHAKPARDPRVRPVGALGHRMGSEMRAVTEHRVAPFTEGLVDLHLESHDGLTIGDARVEAGTAWRNDVGWQPAAARQASLERTVIALDDRPVALTVGIQYDSVRTETVALVGARIVLAGKTDPRVNLAPLAAR